MKNSFLSLDEIKNLGFASFGSNLKISRKASFYNPEKIRIGNNVRIDDFCILSGQITIGSFVHISAFCGLYGKLGIEIGDYSGISPRSLVFSAMDDFSGEYLINPMVEEKYTNVTGGCVRLSNYVQIGANSIIFPNISIAEGTVTGAFSLVNKSLDEWGIYVGIPVKRIRVRKRNLLKFIDEK
jgi:acetyltransferase-like isoleucine patch superfamily enzyme